MATAMQPYGLQAAAAEAAAQAVVPQAVVPQAVAAQAAAVAHQTTALTGLPLATAAKPLTLHGAKLATAPTSNNGVG